MYRKKIEKINNILALLSTKKELSQKEIEKLTGLSQTQVVRGLASLLSESFIASYTKTGREQHRKGPPANIWFITNKGIVKVLTNLSSLDEFSVIASNHPDLALILKKWPEIKASGADVLVWGKLKEQLELGDSRIDEAIFYAFAQALVWNGDNNPYKKFVTLCKNDLEIKAYLDSIILAKKTYVENLLKSIDRINAHLRV